ncbi:hypothetical protein Pcinc_041040 [Petrolisthes cinctipes]|uniref:Uncharacterized protein n=1 Tax=Petrolisthes cinctipes TaxID=88211 RepID=A0AAE1EIU1_PETCI|nr:hypothetical protein Pcinc_041040 [Petrolisthes cinctipes]
MRHSQSKASISKEEFRFQFSPPASLWSFTLMRFNGKTTPEAGKGTGTFIPTMLHLHLTPSPPYSISTLLHLHHAPSPPYSISTLLHLHLLTLYFGM